MARTANTVTVNLTADVKATSPSLAIQPGTSALYLQILNPVAWQPNHSYATPIQVHPTASTVTTWQATTGGTSGATEPNWSGAHVSDGTITWTKVSNVQAWDTLSGTLAWGFDFNPAWQASYAYPASAIVQPTVFNGFLYQSSGSGTSGAAEPSSWPTTIGQTVNDGGVTWTCIQTVASAWMFLVGQDPAVGGAPLNYGVVDKAGNPPMVGGSLPPALAGEQLRAYGTSSITTTLEFQLVTQ